MDENYSVYIHTNKINNKKYIGLTGKQPEQRWSNGKHYNHSTHFNRAIQKYGWDNFEHEIVKTHLTAEEASELEKELIKKYDTTNMEHGYNLDSGGSRTTHSNETKEKIRKAITGIKRSDKTKEKLRKAAIGNKNSVGKHHTEEARQKNREAHIGKTHTLSEEAKLKISLSQKTRKEIICVELNLEFHSVGATAKYFGTAQGNISQALTGRSKTCLGYHWKYKQ